MKLKLVRTKFTENGTFGELRDEHNKVLFHTLEHSYFKRPKVKSGEYRCVRGPHRLHSMTTDFETFEVTGVRGHKGILFHWGNFNNDSDGCILVGSGALSDRIVNSRRAFSGLMDRLAGLNNFQLEVINDDESDLSK